jgi:hypothetical protein
MWLFPPKEPPLVRNTIIVRLEQDRRYGLLLNGTPYSVELNGRKRAVRFRSRRMALAYARLYSFLLNVAGQ